MCVENIFYQDWIYSKKEIFFIENPLWVFGRSHHIAFQVESAPDNSYGSLTTFTASCGMALPSFLFMFYIDLHCVLKAAFVFHMEYLGIETKS